MQQYECVELIEQIKQAKEAYELALDACINNTKPRKANALLQDMRYKNATLEALYAKWYELSLPYIQEVKGVVIPRTYLEGKHFGGMTISFVLYREEGYDEGEYFVEVTFHGSEWDSSEYFFTYDPQDYTEHSRYKRWNPQNTTLGVYHLVLIECGKFLRGEK